MSSPKKGLVNFLQQFSIPLIVGVFAALAFANVDYEAYHHLVDYSFGVKLLGHDLTPHFLINDIFMVFFFGIAAKEITESVLPGGSLNPPSKAITPLFATIGGVVGPVGVFFGVVTLFHGAGAFPEEHTLEALQKGWGVPTATDIALAWLVARAVFGAGHPMVNFLLLLAVADDAIGLAIIAIFYPDPLHPAEPAWLGLVALAMGIAFVLRKMDLKSWWPTVFIAGPMAWLGLMLAHLHPALALVFIVPFLPGPRRDTGLFRGEDEVDVMGEKTAADLHMDHSPLHNFEHSLKAFVDFGLFFFAFANAGVAFSGIGAMTWSILLALVVGKTFGIALFAWMALRFGFSLPNGTTLRHATMAGFVAALGLTVALFVAGEAFTDPGLQGQAKMGALLSGLVGLVALPLGKFLRVKD